jgi:hypothetical protein
MAKLPHGKGNANHQGRENAFKNLSPHQVVMIDEALDRVGEFGEVRLVVQKGKLRFIVTQTSHDALKWEFGGDGDSANEVRTS